MKIQKVTYHSSDRLTTTRWWIRFNLRSEVAEVSLRPVPSPRSIGCYVQRVENTDLHECGNLRVFQHTNQDSLDTKPLWEVRIINIRSPLDVQYHELNIATKHEPGNTRDDKTNSNIRYNGFGHPTSPVQLIMVQQSGESHA